MIKGFQSLHKAITTKFNSLDVSLFQIYATLTKLSAGKVGLDVLSRYLSLVSSGNALDAVTQGKRILLATAHTATEGQFIRFTSGALIGQEIQIEAVIANEILLSGELSVAPAASDTYSLFIPMSPTLNSSGTITTTEGITTVVDFLDTPTLVPSVTNIPASASNPVQVVAALAGNVTKIQSVSDVGEFVNLYIDSLGTTLIAHIPLTPDEIVDVDIPAGSSIYIRNAKNAIINDANSIVQFNFIG